MNPFTSAINYYKKVLGTIAGGDYTYTVRRPTYTAVDNLGTLVASGKFFIEPASLNWTQDKMPETEYFSVCGDNSLFAVGDVLGATGQPTVTICQEPDSQEWMAFKTSQLGTITGDGQANIHTNVWYDFCGSSSAGSKDLENIPVSQTDPVRRLVLFDRSTIKEGMLFIDAPGNVWKIDKIDRKYKIAEIFVSSINRV